MLPARRRSFAAAVLGALSLAGAMGALAHPRGAYASPGVPDPPTALFGEDFENNPSASVVGVTSYTGAAPLSETYTTDPAWAPDASSCNGWITAFAPPGFCGAPASHNVQLMARALGTFAGDATPDDNHVVSAYTHEGHDPGANKIELETAKPIPVPAGSRFLVFSADVADITCGPQRPSPYAALFAFFLLTGSTEIPLASGPTDVCSAGGDLGNNVIGGRITSAGSILFSGTQLGVRLRNAQG